MTKKNPKNNYPLLLFIGSFLVRLLFMEPALTHHDSIVSAQILETFVQQGTLGAPIGGRYGFILINLLFYLPVYFITGANADFFLRLSGVFFGALAIVGVYYFTYILLRSKKDYQAKQIGLIAAILYSVTPLFLSVSTTAKEHSMSVASVMCACALALYAEEKQLNWMRIAAAIAFVFSITVRESNLVFVPVYLMAVILKMYNKKYTLAAMQQSVVTHLITISIFFYTIYELYFQDILQGAIGHTQLGRVTFKWWLPKVMKLALVDLYHSVTLSVILLAMIGTYLLLKSKCDKETLFFALWFIGPFYYFSNTNGYNARYLTIVIIPLIILAAIPLQRVFKLNRRWGVGLLVVVCAMLFATISPLIMTRASYTELPIIDLIQRSTPPESIIIAGDWGPHVSYYTDRLVRHIPVTTSKKAIEKYIKEFKIQHDQGTEVYLMTVGMVYDVAMMQNTHRDILEWNFYLVPVDHIHMEDYHHGSIKYAGFTNTIFQMIPLEKEWYEKTENITLDNFNMTQAVVIHEDIDPLLNP